MTTLEAAVVTIGCILCILGLFMVYFDIDERINNPYLRIFHVEDKLREESDLHEKRIEVHKMALGQLNYCDDFTGGGDVLPVAKRTRKANRSRNGKRRNTAKRSRKASKGKSR